MRTFILARLNREEQRLGQSLEHLRHMVRVSLPAFLRFSKIFSISKYRRCLPMEPYHVARIVAARNADCGTCVQIEVNLARGSGISNEILQAVIGCRPDALPEPLREVYMFVEAVVQSTGEDALLRERIVQVYGEKGLIELAMAIGSSCFLVLTKKALGYATKCSDVVVTV